MFIDTHIISTCVDTVNVDSYIDFGYLMRHP
jgi:hypothetical protein